MPVAEGVGIPPSAKSALAASDPDDVSYLGPLLGPEVQAGPLTGDTVAAPRAALRAALMTTEWHMPQREVRAIVKAVYKLRSELVHKGSIRNETRVLGETVNSRAVVERGMRICAEIVRRILARGAIPDWSHFDLGLPHE